MPLEVAQRVTLPQHSASSGNNCGQNAFNTLVFGVYIADSQVALSRFQKHPTKLKLYAGSCVMKIQALTLPADQRYVIRSYRTSQPSFIVGRLSLVHHFDGSFHVSLPPSTSSKLNFKSNGHYSHTHRFYVQSKASNIIIFILTLFV